MAGSDCTVAARLIVRRPWNGSPSLPTKPFRSTHLRLGSKSSRKISRPPTRPLNQRRPADASPGKSRHTTSLARSSQGAWPYGPIRPRRGCYPPGQIAAVPAPQNPGHLQPRLYPGAAETAPGLKTPTSYGNPQGHRDGPKTRVTRRLRRSTRFHTVLARLRGSDSPKPASAREGRCIAAQPNLGSEPLRVATRLPSPANPPRVPIGPAPPHSHVGPAREWTAPRSRPFAR